MLEMLRRQTQTRRRAVRSTTSHACGLYPAVGAASMDPRGVIIGREAYSGKAYIYDPFILYNPQARIRLASGHALILGKSGYGKSALEKTYVLRQLRFRDRSFAILDAQGEDGAPVNGTASPGSWASRRSASSMARATAAKGCGSTRSTTGSLPSTSSRCSCP